MLTISKPLSASQVRTYHEREFASERQNYWSRDQQGHSEWQGKLAEQWGLSGPVGNEHFARLTKGQHPTTEAQLVRHQVSKTYEGKFGKEVTSVEHRAGWDATFSAPKSVSLTALVGGDERVREAHRESVRVALTELEKYTARVLAAMIRGVGLVASHQTHLFDYAWAMLRSREDGKPNFSLQGRFKATFAQRCVRIRFLGLFDTVSSVGWIYDPLVVPYTRNNDQVDEVRHAVSLDERRCFFRQNLWDSDPSDRTTVKEVWFAGAHSDIGGGYPPVEPTLTRVALHWMLREAHACGLEIDEDAANEALKCPQGEFADRIAPTHDSMTLAWKLAEWVPRLVWDKTDGKRRLRLGAMPPFRKPYPRFVPDGSLIHRSVKDRLQHDGAYQPPALGTPPLFVDDV